MHQCTKFILFWDETLHVSDGLSVHLQELKTVHTATGICQTDTAIYLLAVKPYRRFGKTYLSHLQVSRILELPLIAA